MDVSEIKDRETLEAWLNTRPREDALVIAFRQVCRHLPLALSKPAEFKEQVSSLILLRVLFVAGVTIFARSKSLDELIAQLNRTDAARLVGYGADSHNVLMIFDAALVSLTIGKDNDHAARRIRQFHRIASSVNTRSVGFLSDLKTDISTPLHGAAFLNTPLWPDGPPEWFTKADQETRAIWAKEPEDWEFWTRWWDSVIKGEPLLDQLLHDIALIPDAIWKQGPGPVAEEIRRIEARFVFEEFIRKNPYALDVYFNAAARKLASSPSETPDLDDIISSIERLIEDFKKRCKSPTSGNIGKSLGHSSASILRGIKKDLKRYRDQPLYLFDALCDARNELASLRSYEGFDEIPILDRLLLGLERSGNDICAASPQVLATERNRAAVQLERYSANQIALAVEISRGMQGDSEGLLHAAAGIAVRTLSNPESSADDKKAAWYFVTAVVPRGAKAIIEQKDEVAPPRRKGKLEQAAEIGGHFDKIDKGLDAIQEAAKEWPEWVSQASDLLGAIGSAGA